MRPLDTFPPSAHSDDALDGAPWDTASAGASACVRVLWCVLLSLGAALLMVCLPAQADDSQAPKAESPYFFVDSREPGVDRLPLKSTQVDVRISGVIADVTVTQRYRNEGQRPIEARYVFPGSTQAAVHAMSVRLGQRLITARIQEKQAARLEYESAKKEGKAAALLEQHRPNVFEMNVANILPGDDVAVELRYTELLVPTQAQYAFVFPTVVGPRYNAPAAGGGNAWAGMPFLKPGEEGKAPPVDIRVHIDAPVAVKELASPSHRLETQGLDSTHVEVSLAQDGGRPANNRDFILNYRLAGDRIESGVMLYRGVSENFFLAMVEPPKAPATAQINPREYIFVVDISGSMHGYPLDTAKALLQNLIGSLRPSDTFNVMLFSGSSQMLAPQSVPATRPNIAQALRTLSDIRGGGGTEIVPALRRIAALPKAGDVSRSVIVVTDGYVTVENEVFALVRQNLGQSNVFAFGIGHSVNRHLIEGIARAGQGEAFIVTQPDQAAAQAERLRAIIDSPVLTQVKARFEGLDAYDVQPAQLPDVMAGRPVLWFGKWRAPQGQAVNAQLVVEGQAASGPWRAAVPVQPGQVSETAAALRHLWARQRIASLSDEEALQGGTAFKARITDLGLQYSLLTPYTSFIAVDQVVRNPEAAASSATVDQPSPLPEGVGPMAVGGATVPSTPEPAAWLALLVVAGVVASSLLSKRGR